MKFFNDWMKPAESINKILLLLTLPLLLVQLYNSNCNSHLHKLESGVVVEHAHPFAPSSSDVPVQSHGHSAWDYFVLGFVASPVAIVAFFVALIFALFALKVVPSRFYRERLREFQSDFSFLLRGPPCIA